MTTDLERAVEAARRIVADDAGYPNAPASDRGQAVLVARALLDLREWRPIGEAPVTATDAEPYERLPALVYGREIGVWRGTIYRFSGHMPAVNIGHLHGDAVKHWGVTHYLPLPLPPTKG